MSATRREFLGTAATVAAVLAEPALEDGPKSDSFASLPIQGNAGFEDLSLEEVSSAPRGVCVSWGIPFRIERPVVFKDATVTEQVQRLKAEWLVFLHTSGVRTLESDDRGFVKPPLENRDSQQFHFFRQDSLSPSLRASDGGKSEIADCPGFALPVPRRARVYTGSFPGVATRSAGRKEGDPA
jgi:hypothetical protein